MKNSKKILLVIPAYNEAENLPKVVANIEQENQKRSAEDAIDYIIVSDGSTDGTERLCKAAGYPFISLPVNLGLAGCFQAGMKYAYRAGYAYAVQFDGDGQHRAEDVPALLQTMESGDYDIVLGSRFLEKKKGGSMRELGSRLITAAIRMTTGKTLTDPTCGLRMYDRKAIASFANELNYEPEPDTISYLIKNGAKFAETPVVINDRLAGESYLKPWNAIRYMTHMLVSILLIQNFRKRK